ncbi:hypothetical protein DICPUDRAFT_31947 [Dictyostelium purpureum]|uniref:N-acetyltransferase domain-containing protein n=1 Tax=Dictyostelium purpureum TaxID=5786 RepID=F0ZI48_DICPU|nr:uncharacterized protein DICPUDRAFT_31947 [Dictyostelium purpureum]EGC36396.1 hypothetical protein DICPUDRAFT_31947 [Dictyostelium purpureum]|eukprot:XP_003287093.1 hypothetical protein DICPUDRAFT_31947 [Dictyostelium purpureum]
MSELPPVVNNEVLNKYQMVFPNGEEAVIEYKIYNNNEYDLYHTYVPDSQRGRNVADVLSTQTINDITHNRNGKVLLSCSYLSNRWLPKNPEYIRYVLRMIKK